MRLTQVLVNLLNNAVKFTPPGGHIWLIAETVGEESGVQIMIRIRVRDTGIGIAPETARQGLRHVHAGRSFARAHRGGLGVYSVPC